MLSGSRLLTRPGGDTHATPTIDQVIARAIGTTTRFASLETAAQPHPKPMSYNGPDNTNPPEWVPARLFERLFGGGFVAPGEGGSSIPACACAAASSTPCWPTATGSRRGWAGWTAPASTSTSRASAPWSTAWPPWRPTRPTGGLRAAGGAPEELPADAEGRYPSAPCPRLVGELVVMALACDQTRVFTHVFTDPVNNMLFPGASAGHHQLTHDEPGDQPEVAAIMQHVVAEYAWFVQALRAVPEGGETLLDHCVLLGTTDVALARTHSLEDYPILLAGSACGALKPGLHYRSPGDESASKVMLSLLRAMDLRVAEWGVDTARVTDGLSAIEA
ncbi:MAG: DUF1552 domain-containing protein [bacterium]